LLLHTHIPSASTPGRSTLYCSFSIPHSSYAISHTRIRMRTENFPSLCCQRNRYRSGLLFIFTALLCNFLHLYTKSVLEILCMIQSHKIDFFTWLLGNAKTTLILFFAQLNSFY
jgi:hypothetical protein